MNLLEETKEIFNTLRSGVVVAMQKLHRVKEEGVWDQVASSWGEYVESELGISQGFSSKLLSVNEHYLLSGAVSPEQITGIDYEKLYMARSLPGTIEEQLSKAKTLTRRELKEEKNDDTPCTHEEIRICKHCGIRL